MITIVDYGAGNIRSVANMLRALGVGSTTTGEACAIATADKLILPGVGHFGYGMAALNNAGLVPALGEAVDRGVPLLGVCLGAQLLTDGSEEGGTAGLGYLAADTLAFDKSRLGADLKVPHMGWADVWAVADNPLLPRDETGARFYHVHSFHIAPREPDLALMHAHHGYDFVTGIGRGNVMGVQFHPEKSHRFGMALMKRFATWTPDGRAKSNTRTAA